MPRPMARHLWRVVSQEQGLNLVLGNAVQAVQIPPSGDTVKDLEEKDMVGGSCGSLGWSLGLIPCFLQRWFPAS